MKGELKELAVDLYNIDAVKFGEFVTKVGLRTPVYFDLRVIIAHPKIMQTVARALWQFAEDYTDVTQLCGVPYTALPLATLISVNSNTPMLIKRKEVKSYGTKKLIEGQFKQGDRCVIIEDVVTSGSSILETVQALEKEGLKVTEAFVVIDREQGGRKNLEKKGIKMRSLYTVTQLMQFLLEAGKITAHVVKDVAQYLKATQASLKTPQALDERLKLHFSERASSAKNPLSAKLLRLMDSKQSTVCLSADLTKANAILELADLTGPHIVVLKTHMDIVEDFSHDFANRLKQLAKKHDFLILEDRKFGDIGNIVSLQYSKGIHRIAEWADLITVHPVAGATIVNGLKDGLRNITEPRGIFFVVEMSSKGALTTGEYVENALAIAESCDIVVGLVCQSNIFSDAGLIQLTPGVKICEGSDDLGQQYNTPEHIVSSGADLAVVGRGITEARDKLAATLNYKRELWHAYKKRIGLH